MNQRDIGTLMKIGTGVDNRLTTSRKICVPDDNHGWLIFNKSLLNQDFFEIFMEIHKNSRCCGSGFQFPEMPTKPVLKLVKLFTKHACRVRVR
jgi:hypothetical protein